MVDVVLRAPREGGVGDLVLGVPAERVVDLVRLDRRGLRQAVPHDTPSRPADGTLLA